MVRGKLDSLQPREVKLIQFIREMGWGEVRLLVQNGQPVLIYEAVRTIRLDDEGSGQACCEVSKRKRSASGAWR
jgi:hypothetical protein